MLGLRMPELLVIGLIVIVLFGPGKLAGVGSGLGEAIRGFKKALDGSDERPVNGAARTSGPEKPAGPGDAPRA